MNGAERSTADSAQQLTSQGKPLSPSDQAHTRLKQFHEEAKKWGNIHFYHDPFDGQGRQNGTRLADRVRLSSHGRASAGGGDPLYLFTDRAFQTLARLSL